MLIKADGYSIEICESELSAFDYPLESKIDAVLNPGKYSNNSLSKTLSVTICCSHYEKHILLVCSYHTQVPNCAIYDSGILTLLLDDAIAQLRISDCTLTRYTKLECFGCNDAIYCTSEGYIIHGECEILMLDSNFLVKWKFSGKDIFESTSGKVPFSIQDDKICLYDFDDNYYELDFKGNQLCFIPNKA